MRDFNKQTIDWIKERFYYDPTSPSGVRYKQSTKKSKKGDPVGYIVVYGKKPYYKINVMNQPENQQRMCSAHHLVQILNDVDINDDLVTDHVDCNSLNNNIENLRRVTSSSNNRNRGMKRGVSTSYKGICKTTFNKKLKSRTIVYDVYNVPIRHPKKTCKVFNITTLGEEEALRQALEYRDQYYQYLKDNPHLGYTDLHLNE